MDYQSTCIVNGCKHNASKDCQHSGKYCAKHIVDDTRCIYGNCTRIGAYDYPVSKLSIDYILSDDSKNGTKCGKYCSYHKLEGMVRTIGQKCIVMGCHTAPTFGYMGTTKRLYCAKHCTSDTVNLNTAYQCKYKGCRSIGRYLSTDGVSLYCRNHRQDNLLDVSKDTCRYKGCTLRTYYSYLDKSKKLYCPYHRQYDMINPSMCPCNMYSLYYYRSSTACICTQRKSPDPRWIDLSFTLYTSVATHRVGDIGDTGDKDDNTDEDSDATDEESDTIQIIDYSNTTKLIGRKKKRLY